MNYVLKRLSFFLLTVWVAVTFNFLLPRMMPGNPALTILTRLQAAGHSSPQALNAIKLDLGLNHRSGLLSQYWHYLVNSAHGQFGVSYSFFPNSVSHEILQALPWTLGLVGVTTVIAFVLGTFFGTLSAWFRGGKLDSVLPPLFVVLSSFPYFWIALLFILLFGDTLRWLPVSGSYTSSVVPNYSFAFLADVLRHSILPAVTIILTAIGGWILTMRNNMITVIAEDYVRMARSMGLPTWKVMWSYAGRNAVLPNLTGFGMSMGFVVSGAVLVEYVFNYPGIGWMLLYSVSNEDYPLMQALFLLITLSVLFAVLLVDLLVAWLDPRTRATR